MSSRDTRRPSPRRLPDDDVVTTGVDAPTVDLVVRPRAAIREVLGLAMSTTLRVVAVAAGTWRVRHASSARPLGEVLAVGLGCDDDASLVPTRAAVRRPPVEREPSPDTTIARSRRRPR